MNEYQNKFYAALAKDIPRSFVFEFKNQSYLSGPYAEILQNYAYYHNMTLDLTLLKDVPSKAGILQYLTQGTYDILTFSSTYRQEEDNLRYSYPVEWMRKCIMVPLGDEMPKYLYIIWPYGRYIWTMIILGSIYIAILMRIIDTRSGSIPTRSIIRNIPHAFNITLYTMNMQTYLKNPPVRMIIFYMMLYLYGFVLSAYHQPYLTAYNMKNIFLPPLNTVQDILDAKLKIIIMKNDLTEMQKDDLSGIEHILSHVSGAQFQALLNNYTRTFAYVVSKDHWEFMKKQQQNMKKPYFHLTPLCFSSALRSFSILANRKTTSAFNMFLLKVQQSGLWRLWIDTAFARAVASGHAQRLLDTFTIEPLNIEYFLIAWGVLATGLSCSSLTILMEHFIWRYRVK